MAVREGHCRGPAFPGPPVATMLSLLQRRLAEPLAEPDVAESRLAPRYQRPFTEFGPEVPRVRIGYNLAGVVVCGEALTDQFVETELLRTGHFDDAVDWGTYGDRADRLRDVLSRRRLKSTRWHPAVGPTVAATPIAFENREARWAVTGRHRISAVVDNGL